MTSHEQIEQNIIKIQQEIQRITDMVPPTPLPPVPMGANLARGSDEMWQIYQYQLSEYEKIIHLPSEKEFLQDLLQTDTGLEKLINARLILLEKQNTVQIPLLRQPTSSSRPPCYEDKLSRAKLIAQHLLQEQECSYDPLDNLDKIKQLQDKLMELEEQYLEN